MFFTPLRGVKDKNLLIKDENLFLKDLRFFWRDVGMLEFYIFRYKAIIFVLLVGETVIFSLLRNWHNKIYQTFHRIIDQIIISNKIKNLVDNHPVQPWTYTPTGCLLEVCQRFVSITILKIAPILIQ